MVHFKCAEDCQLSSQQRFQEGTQLQIQQDGLEEYQRQKKQVAFQLIQVRDKKKEEVDVQ